MTLDVLVAILESCNCKDDKQRKYDKTGGYGRELVKELKDGDTKEEARNN